MTLSASAILEAGIDVVATAANPAFKEEELQRAQQEALDGLTVALRQPQQQVLAAHFADAVRLARIVVVRRRLRDGRFVGALRGLLAMARRTSFRVSTSRRGRCKDRREA